MTVFIILCWLPDHAPPKPPAESVPPKTSSKVTGVFSCCTDCLPLGIADSANVAQLPRRSVENRNERWKMFILNILSLTKTKIASNSYGGSTNSKLRPWRLNTQTRMKLAEDTYTSADCASIIENWLSVKSPHCKCNTTCNMPRPTMIMIGQIPFVR